MTVTFEDGDVKNVPLDLVVLPEEAEKAKEYAAAVVQVRTGAWRREARARPQLTPAIESNHAKQAWARGTIARARYRPVLLKRLAAKREAAATSEPELRDETIEASEASEAINTTAAAANALSKGDQGTALKLLLQELDRQRLAVNAMSTTIAELKRSQLGGATEQAAAAELVKRIVA